MKTRKRDATFKIGGPGGLGGFRLDGTTEGTVTIHPTVGVGGYLFTVRPKGRRRAYTLALGMVAERFPMPAVPP